MTRTTRNVALALAAASAVLIAACHGGAGHSSGTNVPGDTQSHAAFAGIGADETVRFVGTEPFWGGELKGDRFTYSTPSDPEGTATKVKRFAGRGGMSFSGTLDGAALDVTVTPTSCSDGMSDRRFPFAATLRLGSEQRSGCAFSDRHPYTGP